jgi:F-type H+-transporting ATPase subunit gamma
MAKTRDIQRRIKSVTSTKKITKAMEMVAAAKMRKAVEAVLKTRAYANLSWETVLNLARTINQRDEDLHPLLTKRTTVKKVGIILITGNRGLCGVYNNAVINKVHQSILKHHYHEGKLAVGVDLVLLGKKGEAIYRYFGYRIAAEFPKNDIVTSVQEVFALAKMVKEDFLSGQYDKILLAYTDFVNARKQVPRLKQILPIDILAHEEYLGQIEDGNLEPKDRLTRDKNEEKQLAEKYKFEYLFEPSPKDVLDEMLPRLIEVQLFQALLESTASEHSARMVAMRQATDAAGEMVDELTLFYNKARQAGITAELAEITAGANALKE